MQFQRPYGVDSYLDSIRQYTRTGRQQSDPGFVEAVHAFRQQRDQEYAQMQTLRTRNQELETGLAAEKKRFEEMLLRYNDHLSKGWEQTNGRATNFGSGTDSDARTGNDIQARHPTSSVAAAVLRSEGPEPRDTGANQEQPAQSTPVPVESGAADAGATRPGGSSPLRAASSASTGGRTEEHTGA